MLLKNSGPESGKTLRSVCEFSFGIPVSLESSFGHMTFRNVWNGIVAKGLATRSVHSDYQRFCDKYPFHVSTQVLFAFREW